MMIPEIGFDRVAERIAAYLDPFKFNPHQGWFGTSRAGKSFTIRHGVLPLFGMSRIVVMDIKPGGSRTWNEYGNKVDSLKPGFGIGDDGTPHYHMLVSDKKQAEYFFRMILAEGSCVVVIDDSRRITANHPDFGLSGYVDQLLNTGAEYGITVIICANSTTWATSSLRDQCGIYMIGRVRNEDERKQFMRYAGVPKETLPILARIKTYQFLYSDVYDGELRLALTTLPEQNT